MPLSRLGVLSTRFRTSIAAAAERDRAAASNSTRCHDKRVAPPALAGFIEGTDLIDDCSDAFILC